MQKFWNNNDLVIFWPKPDFFFTMFVSVKLCPCRKSLILFRNKDQWFLSLLAVLNVDLPIRFHYLSHIKELNTRGNDLSTKFLNQIFRFFFILISSSSEQTTVLKTDSDVFNMRNTSSDGYNNPLLSFRTIKLWSTVISLCSVRVAIKHVLQLIDFIKLLMMYNHQCMQQLNFYMNLNSKMMVIRLLAGNRHLHETFELVQNLLVSLQQAIF